MNRRTEITLVALSAAATFALCVRLAGQVPPDRTGAETRPVTDAASRTVRVPARPLRVLSLCTSATDTIVRLGAADRLAAIEEHGRIVPGSGGATVVGKGSAISQEQVLALSIDLAFVWWYQDDAAETLARLSVPIVRMRCRRAEDVPGMVRLVGRCLDLPAAADRLAGQVEAALRDAPPEIGGRRPARVLRALRTV